MQRSVFPKIKIHYASPLMKKRKIYTTSLAKGIYTVNITKKGFAPYQETINVDNTSKAFHL